MCTHHVDMNQLLPLYCCCLSIRKGGSASVYETTLLGGVVEEVEVVVNRTIAVKGIGNEFQE